MQVSARILGRDYGLTAEEMNRILVKSGFLKGSPGNYSLTEKAMQYAVEKDFHRGTGGYSFYNRYWTTRTFDDSIKEVLDVSPDLINEVREEISSAHAARYAAQAAARAQADAEFLAKQVAEEATREASERAAVETKELIDKWRKAGKVSLIIGGVLVVGYGVYKAAPHIKKWWQKQKCSRIRINDGAQQSGGQHTQMCLNCDRLYDSKDIDLEKEED